MTDEPTLDVGTHGLAAAIAALTDPSLVGEVRRCGQWLADGRKGGRSALLSVISFEPMSFSGQFWEQGVSLARMGGTTMTTAARTFESWLSGVPVRQFVALDAVEPSDACVAYEQGADAYVARAWRVLQDDWADGREGLPRAVHTLIAICKQHNRLARLMPFTSMTTLCFSRSTGFPFSVTDCPSIEVRAGPKFLVTCRGLATTLTTPEGAADAAARAAVSLGRAHHGTARDD